MAEPTCHDYNYCVLHVSHIPSAAQNPQDKIKSKPLWAFNVKDLISELVKDLTCVLTFKTIYFLLCIDKS